RGGARLVAALVVVVTADHRDADADDDRGDHRDRADQQALGVRPAAAAAAVPRLRGVGGGGAAGQRLGGRVVRVRPAVRALLRGGCLLAVLPGADRPYPVDRVRVAVAPGRRLGPVGLTVGVEVAERVVVLGRARAVVAGRHPLVLLGTDRMRYAWSEWRAYPH